MMSWMKNLTMFNSSMTACNKIWNQSDSLWFWKTLSLMRILTDLLKFWKFVKLLKVNLLSIFLCLQSYIVCYFYEQSISIWEFIVLIWVKMNSKINTALLSVSCSWLESVWRCFFRFLFCMSFWKTFLNSF